MSVHRYDQSELARQYDARCRAVSRGLLGKPKSEGHRRAISESIARWWAERRAAKAALAAGRQAGVGDG